MRHMRSLRKEDHTELIRTSGTPRNYHSSEATSPGSRPSEHLFPTPSRTLGPDPSRPNSSIGQSSGTGTSSNVTFSTAPRTEATATVGFRHAAGKPAPPSNRKIDLIRPETQRAPKPSATSPRHNIGPTSVLSEC